MGTFLLAGASVAGADGLMTHGIGARVNQFWLLEHDILGVVLAEAGDVDAARELRDRYT